MRHEQQPSPRVENPDQRISAKELASMAAVGAFVVVSVLANYILEKRSDPDNPRL